MKQMVPLSMRNFLIGPEHPLTLIAGPCVIEGEALAMETAGFLASLTQRLGIQLIYKSSYDKANRSSYHSFRGVGMHEGLRMLDKVSTTWGIPTLTDIHAPEEAQPVAEVCDIIQIPALLCRQTDLLTAAGNTGRCVNLKKGQFMAPWDMEHAVKKIEATGNRKIILTERGTTFGYNNLVSDFRSLQILRELGYPVCYDASHSTQLPGGKGTVSGGERKFIPTLSQAAIATGWCDVLFLEVHPRPDEAKSDRDTVFPCDQLEPLLRRLTRIRESTHV